MLERIRRFLVTGKKDGMAYGLILECKEAEDPIVKALRMSEKMRQYNTITAQLMDVKTRQFTEYEQIRREDIGHDGRPPDDSLWSYVDARNRWEDGRR